MVGLVTALGSLISRMCGGGLLAKKLPGIVPEIFFGAMFGFFALMQYSPSIAVIVTAWSAAWMQTGHARAYHMGFGKLNPKREPHTLDVVMDRLPFAPGSKAYCWVFMGLKGFLIGLPLGFVPALLFAVAWPMSYHISFRYLSDSWLAEYLSGAFAGLLVGLALM